ncbi:MULTISPECIES: hypothetical protein [unclassified Novosphingobium]|uniref:hypothetical protein n=1 Tax=unclassified Novosphingobium TaxID=2644732 RepID=UPI00095E7A82|nr:MULTISPECIES: hypothetical protein [unclassified Novosphingobium]MDR6707304.1 hypothetical protein [Novosphingobium sp. 1748]OJX96460.1 MAG: hypothetical protein BGP00_18115 [Novosphingobium sp. 63-713]
MTQNIRKDKQGDQMGKTPPAPSTLTEQRDNPGLEAGGTGAVGAQKPAPGERTADRDVGARDVGAGNKGHLTSMPDIGSGKPKR